MKWVAMAFPLSRKLLEKLGEEKPNNSLSQAYISQLGENDTDVCIDGWFNLEEIEKILEKMVEEAIDEEDDRRERLSAYPFEM